MTLIVRPIITEKMTAAGEKSNRYGFIVSKDANKIEIKKAVQLMYNVKVENVWTQNYVGKVKSRNTKRGVVSGVVNKHKKAIVSLIKGDIIDFYSNI